MVLDLVSELGSPDLGVRIDAISRLKRQPGDARSQLAAILVEPKAGTCARLWAMMALRVLRFDADDETEQALVRCLDDPDAAVRRTAIETLGELRIESAVSKIAAHLEAHDPVAPWFRDGSTLAQAAKCALRAIGSPEALALLPPNEGPSGGSSEAERRHAIDTSDDWYHCAAETNEVRCEGPVSFARLVELIHAGEVPYDVMVSVDQKEWLDADTVKRIVRAIPLDRERMFREFIEHGEVEELEEAQWAWSSERMYSFLETIPELAWELIVELIERAPSDNSLGFFAAGPLEDLLSKDGPQFIERVEERAASSAKFRQAVGMLKRLGMSDDVWSRVRTIAEPSNE